LTPIAKIKTLKYLDMCGNHPDNWKGLVHHPNLERVGISFNDLEMLKIILEILEGIDNLEMIAGADVHKIPAYMKDKFLKKRPEVKIGDYGDWTETNCDTGRVIG
jgi:hypothetical protein